MQCLCETERNSNEKLGKGDAVNMKWSGFLSAALILLFAAGSPAGDEPFQKFLGAGVLETAYMAQVNYARHLFNKGNWDASKQTQEKLNVHIDL